MSIPAQEALENTEPLQKNPQPLALSSEASADSKPAQQAVTDKVQSSKKTTPSPKKAATTKKTVKKPTNKDIKKTSDPKVATSTHPQQKSIKMVVDRPEVINKVQQLLERVKAKATPEMLEQLEKATPEMLEQLEKATPEMLEKVDQKMLEKAAQNAQKFAEIDKMHKENLQQLQQLQEGPGGWALAGIVVTIFGLGMGAAAIKEYMEGPKGPGHFAPPVPPKTPAEIRKAAEKACSGFPAYPTLAGIFKEEHALSRDPNDLFSPIDCKPSRVALHALFYELPRSFYKMETTEKRDPWELVRFESKKIGIERLKPRLDMLLKAAEKPNLFTPLYKMHRLADETVDRWDCMSGYRCQKPKAGWLKKGGWTEETIDKAKEDLADLTVKGFQGCKTPDEYWFRYLNPPVLGLLVDSKREEYAGDKKGVNGADPIPWDKLADPTPNSPLYKAMDLFISDKTQIQPFLEIARAQAEAIVPKWPKGFIRDAGWIGQYTTIYTSIHLDIQQAAGQSLADAVKAAIKKAEQATDPS